MKLVKIKDKDILGLDFEFAGKYMFRLYKPDEEGNAIYMPVEVSEDQREYCEALLWTGIKVNQEIKISEGVDYILGDWSGSYKYKIVHMYAPVYVISDRLKEALGNLDLIMYQEGAILYLDEIPEEIDGIPVKQGTDWTTTAEVGSYKIYTEREDMYILSDIMYEAYRDKEVIFTIPSSIIAPAVEYHEVVEGVDWSYDQSSDALGYVILLENPVISLSDRFTNYVHAQEGNPDNPDVGIIYNATARYCTRIPSAFVEGEDYTYSVNPDSVNKIYTSMKIVYLLSTYLYEDLKDTTVIYRIPSHIETQLDPNAENEVLHYPGAYKFPVDYEDELVTSKINDTAHIERINDAIDELGDWTVSDVTNPLQTIVSLIKAYGPEDLASDRLLTWLEGGKYDDISEILLAADSATSTTSTTGSCGCSGSSSAFDLGSSCSAYEKYTAYMTQLAKDSFGSLEYLHKLFFIDNLNGNLVKNTDLVGKVQDLLAVYNGSAASVLTSSNPFCCPSVGSSSTSSTVSNFSTALDYLGTDKECTNKQFIKFWSGKFITEMLG